MFPSGQVAKSVNGSWQMAKIQNNMKLQYSLIEQSLVLL